MTHVCALVFFFLTSFPFQWCGRLRVPLLIVKHRCQVDLLIWDDLHFSNFFFYFFQVSLNKPSVESTKLSMDILPWWGEGRTLRKGLYPSQGWQHPSLGIYPASPCKVLVRLLGSVLDPQWPWPSATLTFCASFAVAAVNLKQSRVDSQNFTSESSCSISTAIVKTFLFHSMKNLFPMWRSWEMHLVIIEI